MDEEKRDGLGRADEMLVEAAEETVATEEEEEVEGADGFETVAWPDVWPEGEVGEEAAAVDEGGGEPKVALFGREFPKKKTFIAAGVAAAVLLAGVGGCALLSRQPEPAATVSQQAGQATDSAEAEAKTMYVNVGVTAEGWDEATSSPVIAHIESDDGEVDFYHAYGANKAEAVAVGDESTCKVTYISPVNADGSIYKVGETKSLTASDEKTSDASATTATLEKVEAGSVTAGDLTNIATQVTEAVKKGDSTLSGDKGSQVVSKVEGNIKNSPAADDDVKQSVEQQAGQAQEEAKKEETAARVPTTSGGSSFSGSSTNSGSGSSGGNSNSGSNQSSSQVSQNSSSQSQSSSQQGSSQGGNNSGGSSAGGSASQHQHSWVHHDAEYTTVHHDAVTHTEIVHHAAVTHTETVHHDAVTHREGCYVCGCGYTVPSSEYNLMLSHQEEMLLKEGSHPGFHTDYTTVTDQAAWDETVTVTDQAAWDETVTVTDQAAWEEQVQTKAAYDSCSCGATK